MWAMRLFAAALPGFAASLFHVSPLRAAAAIALHLHSVFS
jgi:hypothetical protein